MNASRTRRLLQHLPVLVRGRPLSGAERYQPFFIVGSGRCGTTLLRAMLEAHSDVHIPPETFVLEEAVRDYRRYSRLPWGVVLAMVLAKFEFHAHWQNWDFALGPLFRELERLSPERRTLADVLAAVYQGHAKRYKPSA